MALTVTPAELTATALTLTTAAQPNITSVGTLSGLTTAGITMSNGGDRSLTGPLNQSLLINARPNDATEGLKLQINGTPKLSVLQNGSVTIGGTGEPRTVGWGDTKLQIEGTGATDSSISIIRNEAGNNPPYFVFAKSRTGTIGSNTVVQDNDYLGVLRFNGADGTDLGNVAAQIHTEVDGTPTTDDVPGALVFSTSNVGDGSAAAIERLRIDSSGRLLKGTAVTPRTTSGVVSSTQIHGTGYNDASLTLVGDMGANALTAPVLFFAKTRGSAGASTVVSSGDRLGAIFFNGADGSDINTVAGSIDCVVDGTPGSNDLPGRLVFRTSSDDSGSNTERMRIDSSGQVGIGTSLAPDAMLHVKHAGGGFDEVARLTAVANSANDGAFLGFHGNSTSKFYGFIGGYDIDTNKGGVKIGVGNGETAIADSMTKMTIDNTGNVGIGTTSPKRTLQVGNNTQAIAAISLQSTTTGLSRVYMGDNDSTAAEYAGMLSYAHSQDDMQFWTASTHRMKLNATGPVIGDNDTAGNFAYNVIVNKASGANDTSYNSSFSAAHTISSDVSAPVEYFKTVGLINTRAYQNYVNIKTNLTSNGIMFLGHFLGYMYGYGNKEAFVGGYTYQGNQVLSQYSNNTMVGTGTMAGTAYRASDGAICFKIHIGHTSYTEGQLIFRFHSHSETTTRQCTVVAAQVRNDGTNHYA